MTNEQLQRIKDLSPQDFAALGMQHVAFVKRIEAKGQVSWSIHLADGSQIAVADDRDVAFAAVRQQDLEPLNVH